MRSVKSTKNPSVSESGAPVVTKHRGRPKGSKNKVKLATDLSVPAPVSSSDVRTINQSSDVSESLSGAVFVPDKDSLFVPFGHYEDIMNIVLSKVFYPVYVTGLSGNGKTKMIEQVCADAGRELVRVNVTHETDEDMLLGGFRLVNGNTVWFDGPVIRAMKTGALLLLDEVDLNAVKILCLQPVLEGGGVFLKRINTWVKPAPGFNVIATANTKGKGSEDGKFIGTTVMNEAFLERFAVTFEQEYPSQGTERKILATLFNHYSIVDGDFCEALVNWADATRRAYREGAIDEIISTRRLVHIAKAYTIFQDKMKAIELCINRFDVNTKTALLDMYKKFVKTEDKEVKFRDSIDSKLEEVQNLPGLEQIS
jgi:hypothetical protein